MQWLIESTIYYTVTINVAWMSTKVSDDKWSTVQWLRDIVIFVDNFDQMDPYQHHVILCLVLNIFFFVFKYFC